MGVLDQFKIVNGNFVKTGWMNKFNQMLDSVVASVTFNNSTKKITVTTNSGSSDIDLESVFYEISSTSGNVYSVNNKTGYINLTTSDISEGTNFYFTNQLSRNSITFNVSGLNYDSTSGIVTLQTGKVIADYNDVYFGTSFNVSLSGGKTLGKYTNGQTVPATGLTAKAVLLDIATEYIVPTFSAFSITGQTTPIEVGDSISSGSKTFTWSTTTPSNINTNSISIQNISDSIIYATGLANDGSEVINFTSGIAFPTVISKTFRITGTNTQLTNFTRDFIVSSLYKIFYGDSASTPLSSAAVRALPSNRFTNAGNTFTLNTGNSNVIFTVAMPSTNSLVSVIDTSALNANITANYILTTFNVNDFAGTPVSYKVYTMTQAIPYSTSHAHQITIS